MAACPNWQNAGGLWRPAPYENWPFMAILAELTAADLATSRLNELLNALHAGRNVTYQAQE